MAIQNYAIIDHAGAVASCKALYKRAFATAKEKFETVATLKTVCESNNEYFSFMSEDKQKKMKFAMRYKGANPKHVYIVCYSQFDPRTQFIANIWDNRNIPVTFIEEKPAPTSSQKVTRARRCANIWANALGWEFSAPLFRDRRVESIDMYTARQNMASETGSYAAKRTTNPQRYFETFRATASERECEDFFQHYAYLQKNGLLDEFLEPGWHLCPTCGRPVRESADECQWCSTKFEAILLEPFWEDSFDDDPDIDYTPITNNVTVPHFEKIEWETVEKPAVEKPAVERKPAPQMSLLDSASAMCQRLAY